MKPSNCTALIVVEDPGAANFAAALPAALADAGCSARVIARAKGAAQLAALGTAHERVAGRAVATTLLRKYGADVVLVGTCEDPDSLGLRVVDAARSQGIPTIGLVDSAIAADHRFRGRTGDPMAHAPDVVVVPDSWARDAYIRVGFAKSNVAVTGHPHYDRVYAARAAQRATNARRQRALLFPGAGELPIVVFAAEISEGLAPEEFLRSSAYTLKGRGGSTRRTDIVLEEFLDALDALGRPVHRVLRLHPKNQAAEFQAYREEFHQVSAGGSGMSIAAAADMVVGMTSFLLVEAALLGRGTLSIVPRQVERTWLPTIAAGITPAVTSRARLRKALGDALASPPTATSLRILHRHFPLGAAKRVARTVRSAANWAKRNRPTGEVA